MSKTFGNTPFILAVYLATTTSSPELLLSSPFKVHSKQPKSDVPKAAPKRQRAPPPCRPFPAPATGAEARINSLLAGRASLSSPAATKTAAGCGVGVGVGAGASACALGVNSDSKLPCPPPSLSFGGDSGKEAEFGDEERYGSKEAEFELPVPLKRHRGIGLGAGAEDADAAEEGKGDVVEGKCGGESGSLLPPSSAPLPLMPPMGSMLFGGSTSLGRAGASTGSQQQPPSPFLAATYGLPSTTPSFALSPAALSAAPATMGSLPPPPLAAPTTCSGGAVMLSQRVFQASPSLSSGSTATGTTGASKPASQPEDFSEFDFLDFELLEATCGSF